MQHIHRMDQSRLMVAVMKYKYQPAGKINPGCHFKRLQNSILRPECATEPKSLKAQ